MAKRIKRLEQLEIVHPHAGGLDIGAFEIWAALPPDREGETVQSFGTFTPDLQRLADWLWAMGWTRSRWRVRVCVRQGIRYRQYLKH